MSWSDRPDGGGLRPAPATLAPAFVTRHATLSQSADDMLRAIRAASADSLSTITRLIDVLAPAAATPNVSKVLATPLNAAVATHAVGYGERQLIAAIAVRPNCAIPPVWLAESWPAALADPSGVELRRLGGALDAQHLPGSAGALGWADAVLERGLLREPVTRIR